MTVEATIEETQKQEDIVSEENAQMIPENEENVSEKTRNEDDELKPVLVEKSSSYREESNFLSDLKENERKALSELKSMLEEAILGKTLLVDSQSGENSEEKPVNEDEIDGKIVENDQNVSIWGVPLLPSKCSEGTDVILLKFLRAREFKPNDAFEMLKKTLIWREKFKVGSNSDEELTASLANAAYMKGIDRENHPVCYNNLGVFGNESLYQKTFGNDEKRDRFLRWRIELMEKGIEKLDFRASGVTSILQIYDLKNCPGPSKKEIRTATFKAISLLQDNYPELVAKNVLINVPFWYYAFYSLISPFLTQRSKSKFVVARPAKVTETLLNYIPFEEIPIQYGGLKRENDLEFGGEENGSVSEIVLKPGSVETIEIPALEVGKTLIWDFAVLGVEVSYKEEFIPTDEGSYTIIIQKDKKMESLDKPVRNSFRNNEVGKVVITINNQSKKKKRAFYRYKN
ncbi:hypothetical protein RND81_14G152200 [Saponaria officinalis]|uniref:CRAL-TRIO domain-containing protein n=1 Tax=Saponaria officinalis TaxID=3572 RepID=A0AAW1GSU3_SAPOF